MVDDFLVAIVDVSGTGRVGGIYSWGVVEIKCVCVFNDSVQDVALHRST